MSQSNTNEISKKDLLKGIDVELKKCNNINEAAEIALENLLSSPDYYNTIAPTDELRDMNKEDQLQNIEPPSDNHDLWAIEPLKVTESAINNVSPAQLKKSISFVETISDYSQFSKEVLHKHYFNIKRNIKKAITLSHNEPMFYEKLMALKNYLNSLGINEDGSSLYMSTNGIVEDENVLADKPFNVDDLKKIRSYKGRIFYLRNKLQLLGQGSSRIVFKIDNKKVIKLAKNSKGLGQNFLEAELGQDNFFLEVVAKVYDYDPDFIWLISEYADKFNDAEFKKIEGYDFRTLGVYLTSEKYGHKWEQGVLPEEYDAFIYSKSPNSLATNVEQLMRDYNMPVSDLTAKSSYGFSTRNGERAVILIDYGYDENVYKTYYSKIKEYVLKEMEMYLKDTESVNERKLSYMPNSSSVEVKQNCRLAGNSDGTSDACNQGDISNLNLKKLKEGQNTKIEYGAVMLMFSTKNWKKITDKIDKDDIYDKPTFGVETEPHITILYGLHNNVTNNEVFEKIKKDYNGDTPIKVRLLGISFFETPNYDVVKFDVDCDILHTLNNNLKELPYSSDYPEYKPHMTISYVKKGTGKKYSHKFKTPIELSSKKIIYSTVDRNKFIINENNDELEYKKWKRNNVTYRGVSDDAINGENGGMAMLGQGLYSVPASNKSMARKYGKLVMLVNAKPKNPKVFNTLNDWEIWFQNNVVFPISKAKGKKYPDGRDVNSISEEMLKLGYDGVIIKGREIVNYKPEDVRYYYNERQLEMHYDHYVAPVKTNVNENDANENLMKKSLLTNFLDKLEEYQSNHYGYIDRNDLVNAWKMLPSKIKDYIKPKPQELSNLYRGADGVSPKKAISFTDNKKYAEFFGTYVLPFTKLKSYEGLISTDKVVKLIDGFKMNFDIGDDEGEVIVLNPEWKNFNIEKYRATQLSEDLSYSHVTDATQDSYKMGLEENDSFDVYKKDNDPSNDTYFNYKDSLGGEAYGMLKGNVGRIISMNSVPFGMRYSPNAGDFKKRGFFTNLINKLKQNGVVSITIRLQSEETRKAIKRLLEKGVLTNPRNYYGLSDDEYPTLFDISKINEEKNNDNSNEMVFWHGGNLDDYSETIAQRNGRYEYGAGLYMTTSYEVVKRYAKGSRKLYQITVEKGVDINDAFIDTEKALNFINTYILTAKRKSIIQYLSKYIEDGKVPADIFNNLILNHKAIQSTKTKDLRNFLINNGIDYEIVDNAFGFGEKMMVLYNMRKIKNVKQITSKDKIDKYNLLDESVSDILDLPFKKEIESLGGKLYSVGGAVRDKFLGKESKDLDILITGISFEDLEKLLSKYGRVDAVGKSFGILKFKPQGSSEEIDIAIPRTEKATGEGGHKGFEVTSDHSLPIEKDLERRDFTINAIAKDASGNIVDPYGGQEDLKNKIIRIVNLDAFSDDPLRMLRAVQFASRFGFMIEPKTEQLIKSNAQRIKEIPAERILTELDKIVKKGDVLYGADLLRETGLYEQIFGSKSPAGSEDHWDLDAWNNVRTMGEYIYLLASPVQENPAEFYKKVLKGDIPTYKEILALQTGFKNITNNFIGNRVVAHNMYTISPESLNSRILPNPLLIAIDELNSGKYPKGFKELAVTGNDLLNKGLSGKELGDTLKKMLTLVYSDRVKNDKNELLNFDGTA